MTPVNRRRATLRSAGRWALCALLLIPASAAAQTETPDTVRVTYRTREVVFFAAGRQQGVAVGDGIDVLLDSTGRRVVHAVVLSTAQRSSSARLLDPSATVPGNARVAYIRRPVMTPTILALASPDTGAASADRDTTPVQLPVAHTPGRVVSGGLHLDQFSSNAGAGFSSGQTTLGVAVDVPFGAALTFRMRTTSRYRSVSSGVTANRSTTIPYQLEMRIEPPGGRVRASLGRFLASDALALGYLDGVRLEVRPGPQVRFGLAAGLVPDPVRLQFSTVTKRFGGWWGLQGNSAFGTVSLAADWANGALRRTIVGVQAVWSPAPRVSMSLYGDVDIAPGWDTTRSGGQLTSLFGNVRLPLPAGFRFGIGAETHSSVRLWETAADSFALPGRYVGASASLGHDVGRVAVDLSASALQRTDDPTPVLRGMLTLSRGPFFLVASGEHGPLADYYYATGRIIVTPAASTVSLAIGGFYGLTLVQAATLRIQRYSVRPDLSWRLGRGLLLNLGGDFGRYSVLTTTYLHAGVSYYFH